jgi:hypothetical protein
MRLIDDGQNEKDCMCVMLVLLMTAGFERAYRKVLAQSSANC